MTPLGYFCTKLKINGIDDNGYTGREVQDKGKCNTLNHLDHTREWQTSLKSQEKNERLKKLESSLLERHKVNQNLARSLLGTKPVYHISDKHEVKSNSSISDVGTLLLINLT